MTRSWPISWPGWACLSSGWLWPAATFAGKEMRTSCRNQCPAACRCGINDRGKYVDTWPDERGHIWGVLLRQHLQWHTSRKNTTLLVKKVYIFDTQAQLQD